MILIFIFLILSGFISGLLASIAGLASLVSYPALLIIGVSPIIANVTNTASLVFSGIGAIISSLNELQGHLRELLIFTILSLLGSIGGSVLLLIAPSSSFEKVVPFFIFFAGVLLLLSSRRNNFLPIKFKMGHLGLAKKWLISVIGAFTIILVGAYMGYFGAAGGVIFLAVLSIIIKDNFIVVNAIKNVIAFAGNLMATIIFSFNSHIEWEYVLPLGIGLIIGGYIGPSIVRHTNIHLLRVLISVAAFGLAIYLFVTSYF